MITPAEWSGLIAGSSVLSAVVTGYATRRPSMVQAFTKSYTELAKRLTEVEGKVEALESNLSEERTQHGTTKEFLRVALRYIREAVAWATGPKHTEFPPPPAELLKEL